MGLNPDNHHERFLVHGSISNRQNLAYFIYNHTEKNPKGDYQVVKEI